MMSLCDSERTTQKGKRMLKSSRCDAVMPQCLILSQKVLKCHTWLSSLVDWNTIRDPMAWHRWVKHFDMTLLLTSHLGIVSSHCCLEANISYFQSCHCRTGLTNKSLPFLQCRSGSRNVLARASGPVTRALRKTLKRDV